jgi:hypothetical protein
VVRRHLSIKPRSPDLSNIIHHLLDVNGTRIHAVEQGSGPLVVMATSRCEVIIVEESQDVLVAGTGFARLEETQRFFRAIGVATFFLQFTARSASDQ